MTKRQQRAATLPLQQSQRPALQLREDLLRRFGIPAADQPGADRVQQSALGALHVSGAGAVADELQLDKGHGGAVT